MADSPPLSVLDSLPLNPNPNPSSGSESPSHSHHPQIPEHKHQDQNHDQVQIDDVEEEEGTSFTLSSHPHSPISDTMETKGGAHPSVSSARRGKKRKKCHTQNKKTQLSLHKKIQTLKLKLNPIPFVPGKVIDFDKFEVFLTKLGLWDFSQIEFDRTLRVDLVAQVVAGYVPKQRYCYVNECKIEVNRADFGRALKLPLKKVGADCDGEEFSAEFFGFLNEFVSNWMLLHEDSWITPSEVVNWLNMIKDGHPGKVDWPGLVWFMIEKELAQGVNLKDCYYAYHLQHLIKMQKEELFRCTEDVKVDLTVDDDDDGGDDVKMLDSEEFSLVAKKLEEGNLEVRHGQDHVEVSDDQEYVAPMDFGGHGEKMEGDDLKTLNSEEFSLGEKKLTEGNLEVSNDQECVAQMDVCDHGEKVEEVDDIEKVEEVDDTEKVEEVGNSEKVQKVEDVDTVENLGYAQIVGSVNEVCIPESAVSSECALNVVNADEHVLNVDVADELVEDVNATDENVENLDTGDENAGAFDNSENVENENNMMDYSFCKEHEQGNWLMQRCNLGDAKLSIEESRQDGVNEGGIEHGDVEEHLHVEGFTLMQKGPLDGIAEVNLMDAFDPEQLQYPSSDLGGQTSLMLGGPSMFNHVGKREIDHEDDDGHHALNDSHKKMRIDDPWGHKTSDFDMVMDQILHMVDKAKMVHEAEREEAFEQGSLNQQYIGHEMAKKDNEIMMLRCKVDELERRRQTEIHRLDRELYLMNSVIGGYRKALKATQKQFAEYRKQYGVPDEPVYKDAGSGGVVKSIMELEKERIKQEQERKIMCYYLEEEYKKQLNEYESKWCEVLENVELLNGRLLIAAEEVKVLKERIVKRNTCENTENETEDKS